MLLFCSSHTYLCFLMWHTYTSFPSNLLHLNKTTLAVVNLHVPSVEKKCNLFPFSLFLLVLWRLTLCFNILHTYTCVTTWESEKFYYESLRIMRLYIASSGLNSEWWLLGTLSENNYRVLSENKFINNKIKDPKGIYILAFKDKGYAHNKEREVTIPELYIFVLQPAQQASTCGHVECV